MALPSDHNGLFIQGMTDPGELRRYLESKFSQPELQSLYAARLEESKSLARAEKITPLRAFWKLMGRAFGEKSQALQCGRGCAHCCYTGVAATQLEWDGILDNAREKGLDLHKILERSRRTVDRVRDAMKSGKELDATDWHRLVVNQPCPFLQEDQSCAVYEDRPLDCRLVVAYRGKCSSKNLEHAQRGVIPEEAVASTVVARLQYEATPKMKRRKFDGTQKVHLLHRWLVAWEDKNRRKQ